MVAGLLGATTFAFLTAVFWGLSPVVGKRGLERGGTSTQAAMVIIVTTTVMAWIAIVVVEGSTMFRGLTPKGMGIFLLGGAIGTTLGRLAYYAGVRRVGASVAVGVMNSRPIFAVAMGLGFLHETISTTNGVGVVTLVVGVLVLSLSKGGDIRGWRPIELVFPIGAGLAFAAGNVIRRLGYLETSATILEGVALNETAAILTLGGYLLLFRRDQIRGAEPAAVRYFVLSGVIVGMGLFSFFVAISIGQVSIVDPISSMSPLFGTIFTYLLLRDVEHVTRGVIVGAVLIVVGGALVAL